MGNNDSHVTTEPMTSPTREETPHQDGFCPSCVSGCTECAECMHDPCAASVLSEEVEEIQLSGDSRNGDCEIETENTPCIASVSTESDGKEFVPTAQIGTPNVNTVEDRLSSSRSDSRTELCQQPETQHGGCALENENPIGDEHVSESKSELESRETDDFIFIDDGESNICDTDIQNDKVVIEIKASCESNVVGCEPSEMFKSAEISSKSNRDIQNGEEISSSDISKDMSGEKLETVNVDNCMMKETTLIFKYDQTVACGVKAGSNNDSIHECVTNDVTADAILRDIKAKDDRDEESDSSSGNESLIITNNIVVTKSSPFGYLMNAISTSTPQNGSSLDVSEQQNGGSTDSVFADDEYDSTNEMFTCKTYHSDDRNTRVKVECSLVQNTPSNSSCEELRGANFEWKRDSRKDGTLRRYTNDNRDYPAWDNSGRNQPRYLHDYTAGDSQEYTDDNCFFNNEYDSNDNSSNISEQETDGSVKHIRSARRQMLDIHKHLTALRRQLSAIDEQRRSDGEGSDSAVSSRAESAV